LGASNALPQADPQRAAKLRRRAIAASITLASTVITYGLYTTSPRTALVHPHARLIYTLPIALFGLFRYLYLLMEKGYGENTVADVRKDFPLLLACVAYVAVSLLLLAD